MNRFDVTFINCSYDDLEDIQENDLVYCDPPYAKSGGMYDFGEFDNESFFDWLRELPCKYLLSYDGKSGEINNTFEVPNDIYDQHEYICSSQSSFKRIVKGEYVDVYDSLYIKNARA